MKKRFLALLLSTFMITNTGMLQVNAAELSDIQDTNPDFVSDDSTNQSSDESSIPTFDINDEDTNDNTTTSEDDTDPDSEITEDNVDDVDVNDESLTPDDLTVDNGDDEGDEGYEVLFVDSLNNNEVFATFVVDEHGEITDLPEAPVHEGYSFTGYEGNYTDIVQDTIITATYEEELPKTTARIFGEIDGEYTETIITRQDEDTWTDNSNNSYTKNSDRQYTDNDGHIFIFDKTYVDPNYGPLCFGVRNNNSSAKKFAQDSINSMLDYISRTNPEMLPITASLKPLVGLLFGLDGGTNPNAEILTKIDELNKKLDGMEDNLKKHSEDLAVFTSLGGEFQKISDAYTPLANKIGDATYLYDNGKISKDELNRRLAAMYTSPEYAAMSQALSGATNAYGGNTSYSMNGTSIFNAAFNLQCDNVMFSGEALDCTAPYLLRQLTIYIKGYALVNEVLDGYEATAGDDAASATRKTMLKNISGITDGQFNEKEPGVFALYKDYFSTHRFIFVDKTSDVSKHVQLSGQLSTCKSAASTLLNNTATDKPQNITPDYLKKCPLSRDQVNHLSGYCSAKRISIKTLLIDKVGFTLNNKDNLNLNSDNVYLPTGCQNIGCTKSLRFNSYTFTIKNYLHITIFNNTSPSDQQVLVAANKKADRKNVMNPDLIYFVP